jgi:hypothetical protein
MNWTNTLGKLAALAIVALTLASEPAMTAPPPAQGVRITPIGTPQWKPVDFHLFSAPFGTEQTGYMEFAETLLGLLPEPEHAFHPDLFVGPGTPHAPPYDSELADGVASHGYHEGAHFSAGEFSDGMGIYLAWMNVPAPGATGSSPDFASGPIIPNGLFPITGEATNWHNGKPFSFVGTIYVPPLDASLSPPFSVDGHSHFPFFLADNADFGPRGAKLPGSYQMRATMIDATGSGWRIDVHFTVAP